MEFTTIPRIRGSLPPDAAGATLNRNCRSPAFAAAVGIGRCNTEISSLPQDVLCEEAFTIDPPIQRHWSRLLPVGHLPGKTCNSSSVGRPVWLTPNSIPKESAAHRQPVAGTVRRVPAIQQFSGRKDIGAHQQAKYALIALGRHRIGRIGVSHIGPGANLPARPSNQPLQSGAGKNPIVRDVVIRFAGIE